MMLRTSSTQTGRLIGIPMLCNGKELVKRQLIKIKKKISDISWEIFLFLAMHKRGLLYIDWHTDILNIVKRLKGKP